MRKSEEAPVQSECMADEIDGHRVQAIRLVQGRHGHRPQVVALVRGRVFLIVLLHKSATQEQASLT